MGVTRHGSGASATLRALGSQIHPVFMLPAVAASAFGAVLASELTPWIAVLHGGIVFCELYTAHVKDGYVDFYLRGEDESHPLTAWGCRLALWGASTLVFIGLAVLATVVDSVAALLALPGWLIAYFHAPQLDTHPVSATVGYPLGISTTILGGYYAQAAALSATPIVYAIVFLVVLSGIKIIDDATDYEYDRSIDKRTVAVVVGHARARRLATVLMALGLAIVIGGSVLTPIVPPSSAVAVFVFAGIAWVAHQRHAELATMILIRGTYVFLALLVAAVWFQPLR
ncbi:UbiA family prenyltransferase [Halocatena pleomorpha]|uniref:Ubiquinone biosynthesis protein UbiA n=1 Tax=Halocatena pleomorpha TaxID=1785090 RepID=A0A3P3RCQ4_9EURY|nr:UbiA family prenyltransferase [Halocatena pleomorpha]RRJ31287.1 ubiquinone biosynthesis protein UbiA [Halocatena pleomorpha]